MKHSRGERAALYRTSAGHSTRVWHNSTVFLNQLTNTMSSINWIMTGEFTDILYHKAEGIAKITINRPEVRNALRPLTVQEMIRALDDARNDEEIGVIILTGAGDLA